MTSNSKVLVRMLVQTIATFPAMYVNMFRDLWKERHNA